MAQTTLDVRLLVIESMPELSALPVRIQRMIALILTHQDDLCRWHKGCLELHFHAQPGQQESVQAKLSTSLS